jgi:hypothetical protein
VISDALRLRLDGRFNIYPQGGRGSTSKARMPTGLGREPEQSIPPPRHRSRRTASRRYSRPGLSATPLLLGHSQGTRDQLPDCSSREHEGRPGIGILAYRSRCQPRTIGRMCTSNWAIPGLGLR